MNQKSKKSGSLSMLQMLAIGGIVMILLALLDRLVGVLEGIIDALR
ncbi:MAG: hypothetical protein ABIM30_08805 [candidate division WOR-3 bacterium]